MNKMTNEAANIEQKTQTFLDRQKHRMLIGGQWVDASENKRMQVVNPAEETVIGTIPSADAVDVNKAVICAKMPWKRALGVE